MKMTLIVSAVIALGAAGLMTVGQAGAQQRAAANMMQIRQPEGSYGFFAASQPANSNRVGIFVARRVLGKPPELYYCSAPPDATSKDPAACKHIDAFPK